MPFTASHAVVALPFVRTPLLPAAVAVGAMTPDIPLFFNVGIDYWTTHTFPGMFLVGIPLALALLSVWRVMLRPAVPHLTPGWVRARLPQDWQDDATTSWLALWGGRGATARERWRSIALLIVALAIGLATHVFWDLFTHAHRWGSELFPALGEPWAGGRYGYSWVGAISSVFGLVVIAAWMLVWMLRRTPTVTEALTPLWFRMLVPVAIVSCLVISIAVEIRANGIPTTTWTGFAFRAGVSGAAGILIVFGIACIATQLLAFRARHARA
ncbi:MAG: DUF4184 family protein [Salinibacterium sp.]|nr:MAG: DUF4184 family protein [Salinibacterium sp.]